MSSIAVMQPYLFPYVGYFQLINVVDKFVFYDDVDFIKSGWINRNRILINGAPKYFTIPCKNTSSYKKIKDVDHGLDQRMKKKLLKQIKLTYSQATFFDQVYSLVKYVLNSKTRHISEIAINSVKRSSKYLGLECAFLKSSEAYPNRELDARDRLIDICRREDVNNYVNPIGGKKLYNKGYFRENGIKLQFLQPEKNEYKQFGNEFVPWLSIIDVMMFNSPDKIKDSLLNDYQLS